MRLFFLLLCCVLGVGAQAQCLSVQDMRSLLGRTLIYDDPFMASRGFPFGDLGSYKGRWFSADNGLSGIVYTYPAGGGGITHAEYHISGSSKRTCFRAMLSQLNRAAGFVAEGKQTRQDIHKQRYWFYTGPDCGVLVYRGPDGNQAIHVYNPALYLAAKEKLSKQP